MKLFDPTSKPVERAMKLAPRPASPKGLRLGLVDNTKFNSDTLLEKLAERLARRHQMTVTRDEPQALAEPRDRRGAGSRRCALSPISSSPASATEGRAARAVCSTRS